MVYEDYCNLKHLQQYLIKHLTNEIVSEIELSLYSLSSILSDYEQENDIKNQEEIFDIIDNNHQEQDLVDELFEENDV